MKLKNLLFLCMFILPTALLAQIPQAVNYQAVVRDGDGNPIGEQTVSVRLSIHAESVTGPIVYSESHAVTTTTGGLINLAIGQGTIITGTMTNVNWLEYPKYLQVELDQDGGSNFIEMGTSQLVSVPYSFASNVAESLSPGATVDLYQILPGGAAGGQFLMWNGANWVPSTITSEGAYSAGAGISLNGNTIVNTGDLSNSNEIQSLSLDGNVLSLTNGGSITLPNNGGTEYQAGSGITITGTTISATDASATNELQSISISGNVLTLSDGGSVTLPSGGGGGSYVAGNGININGNTISAVDNSATNEMQTLSVNGNTLSILGGNTVNLPTGNTYTAGEGVYFNGTEISAVDVSDINEIQFLNIVDNTITLSGGGGAVSIPNSWVNVAGNNIVNPNGGNVGIDPIGFAVPTATLDVQRGNALDGTAAFRGTNHISHFNYGTSEDTYLRGGKNGSALYLNDSHNGNVNVATGGGGLGIGINSNLSYKAQLASNFGKGMRIEVTGTNPASPEGLAVDNQSASGIDKYGIYSQSTGLGLGSNWGVVGKAFGGSSGYKVGVFGEANGTGLSNTSTGVLGRAISEAGMDNFGVVGEAVATTEAFNFGVFGNSSGNTSVFATFDDPDLELLGCQFCYDDHNGNFGIYGLGTFESTGAVSWAGFFDGDIYGYSHIYSTSDASLKRNISSLNNSIDVVKRLRPVSYNMRTSVDVNAPYSDQLSFGFIAQEMAEVLPELVTTFIHPGDVKKDGDEQNLMAISYDGLIPVLTSCIQEQQQKIEYLEEQLRLMKENMELFHAKMEELKSDNNNR
jgi:hypothetical protein